MRIELCEITDESARAEATTIGEGWMRPETPPWPRGTTVVEQGNSHFDRPDWTDSITRSSGQYETHYHLVTLPSGGQLVTLTQVKDWDELYAFAKAPHVAWSILVSVETGEVSAWPRVCNMSIRKSHAHSDFAKADWIIPELGLQPYYVIGKMRRPLRERTRVEHDGWGY